MNGPQAHWLDDGRRLHLNHGPIDLIVEAFGAAGERQAAYAQAVERFQTILTELVAELPELRKPALVATPTPDPSPQGGGEEKEGARGSFPSPLRGGGRGGGGQALSSSPFTGSTARRMAAAVAPLAETFITPMAAVAGAVADEILAAMLAGRRLDRAYVNNGGDCALHLAEGQSMQLAIAGTGHDLADRVTIRAEDPVRGVATSGWRGRSFSLGIADAVTVLARTSAEADAAATIVANAVDLPGHPAVTRQPACDLAPDSDLGERFVTIGVGVLSPAEVGAALERGMAVAEDLRHRGLIAASALFLAGQSRISGPISLPAVSHSTEKKELAHA
ncbi:UPF0280 family protein [Ollibium composti]|uniref:UPF0280 family protein n=1 Tax=Ollibium composti TaxID=2675109 RepID=A0ABY2Q4S5_9HYPH|nr:UPF0280 family protein [Mesorhizobium composti]THF56301.1 UPF0280 family protein [Mesorhizobium composti]